MRERRRSAADVDRRRVSTLGRRHQWLIDRVNGRVEDQPPTSFDRAELAALGWALPILTAHVDDEVAKIEHMPMTAGRLRELADSMGPVDLVTVAVPRRLIDLAPSAVSRG